ncbi:MAG: type II secretion system protein M [Candidatus Accumulibacter sp.]|jgi:MSHA biogenesis protein MshJ|nr:type II secretion system protein M [Accumulibacter sp.]
MKSWWMKTSARFAALQPRERLLVAAALLGVILVAGYLLFIEPALKRELAAGREIAGARARLKEMEGQMAALNAPDKNPDSVAQNELNALRARLDGLSARLAAVQSLLVPPERMASLLEEVIGPRGGLRLVSLKTLPVEPFPDAEQEKKGEKTGEAKENKEGKTGTKAGLYRHGVEVRLEGGYQDLLAYLTRLEQSPLKLLWARATLNAEHHPRLVLVLTVYSLSLDRAWLVV